MTLVARVEDGGSSRESGDADRGSLQRWTFSEMSGEGFLWRGEGSVDGGSTWTARIRRCERQHAPRADDGPTRR